MQNQSEISLLREQVFLYLIKKKIIPGLRDFSFFLSSRFIYESILIRKIQIFHKIKYDLKGF